MAEEKIIDKIKKLFALAESEEAIGNKGAADNIMAKAQELLIKYRLEHKDIMEVETFGLDNTNIYYAPVVGKSFVVNPFLRVNAKTSKRMYWFEELAKVIADSFFCRCSVDSRTAEIFFYGLDMDREIAVLVFQKFAERANTISKVEMERAKKVVGSRKLSIGNKEVSEIPIHKVWLGDDIFENSFHKGFREEVKEAFSENKQEVSSAVIDYFNNNSGYYERDDYSGTIPAENDEIAILIGRKYAKRVCKKISVGKVAGENGTQALQARAKSNFAGEVIIVMDDSGSMSTPVGNYWERNSEKRVDQAKEGTLAFAEERIKDGHAVGLIKFGTEPTILLYPQLSIDKSFKLAVSKLDASSGNTEMAKAITAAMQSFKNHKVKRTICIVTDGQPSGFNGEAEALTAANEAKRIGIEIATVGCGGANEEFLKKLASKEGLGILADGGDLRIGMRKIAGMLGA